MHAHHRRRNRPRRHHGFDFRHLGLFGNWTGRFFRPGEVRIALLSLLAERPMHGYELMKELGARSGGMYKASAGTIYPTLQQLEDEGLVSSEERDGKRVYQPTPAGRRELESAGADVGRIWQRADEWSDWGAAARPESWEVMRPAMRMMKAAMRAVSHAGSSDNERIDQVREILEEAAEELEELANER